MESAPAATLTLPSPLPVPAAATRAGRPSGPRQLAAFWAFVLACFAADAATVVLLAETYTVKRRLDIDVFPGLNVLPDPQIEAAIRAVAGLFR